MNRKKCSKAKSIKIKWRLIFRARWPNPQGELLSGKRLWIFKDCFRLLTTISSWLTGQLCCGCWLWWLCFWARLCAIMKCSHLPQKSSSSNYTTNQPSKRYKPNPKLSWKSKTKHKTSSRLLLPKKPTQSIAIKNGKCWLIRERIWSKWTSKQLTMRIKTGKYCF